jgi:hypothetical protein
MVDKTNAPNVDMHAHTTRALLIALTGSNVFALMVGGVYEYLSLRGLISMKFAWAVLVFVWLLGVVGIVISEFVWGRGIKRRLWWGAGASIILGLILFAFDRGVSAIVRSQATVSTPSGTTQPPLAARTPEGKPESPGPKVAEKPKTPRKSQLAVPVAPPQQAPSVLCKDNANCGVSTGQSGGITAGQVVLAEESTIPLRFDYSQELKSSATPGPFPYELRVTVRPNKRVEGTSLVLIFDGPVEIPRHQITCMMCGGGRIAGSDGLADQNSVWMFWQSPPLVPERPVTFLIHSRQQVSLVKADIGPAPPF